MLIDVVKSKIEEGVRARDTVASNIFKLILSECQRENKDTDDFIVKFMGKLVEGNNETLKYRVDDKLVRENELLKPYLPILIDRADVALNAGKILDSLIETKSDGQAIGLLCKHLKQLGLDYSMDDIKHVINIVRK